MKKIKILFSFLLAVLVLGFAFGCEPKEKKGLRVVTTSTMLNDLVEQIGKDKVVAQGIMGPGVDPHTYTSVPSDNKKLEKAQLIVMSGLHLEAQIFDAFKAKADEKNIPFVSVGDEIFKQVGKNDQTGMLGWEEDGQMVGEDPHFWNDVRLWKKAATVVSNKLQEVDEKNKEFYKTNETNYLKELDELITFVENKSKEVPQEKRIVVTAHDAFQYFARTFGYRIEAIQGISTESEASPNAIQETANQAVQLGVKAIFTESSIPAATTEAVVQAAKAQGHELKIGGELFSDSLGTKEQGTETYVKMIKHNVNTIIDALK